MAIQKSHYDVSNSTMWQIQSPTTMWLIQKSYYDVANSKPATMQHYLQSLLLHGISKAWYDPASLKAWDDSAPLKARCCTAPFTKPDATRQYFTKSQNHFHKPQILIWHYSTKPNNNLTTIFLKSKY